ncbi:MAG: PepSY-like domain-containing protein [Bacteroidota bacterium]|nr:PepSY-like domain-containing protein [Bacteroidota bacterium]
MKKIFSLLLLYTGMAAAAYAQKLAVPVAVTKAFNTKFPGATDVKWEKENSKELEANFKLNNTNVSANFALDGSWTETETTIKASDLPATVTNAINTKYPGAIIFLAEKIEKPGGIILFEVNLKMNGKKKELELDADGKFAK